MASKVDFVFTDLPDDINQMVQGFKSGPREWQSPTAKCIKPLVRRGPDSLYQHLQWFNRIYKGFLNPTMPYYKVGDFEELVEYQNALHDLGETLTDYGIVVKLAS